MSIQPPNGILDITGATLRVSKMEFSNVTGFDTVLNNVARNTVLHVDTTEYTANVAYAVKPPNMFMAQFDLELSAGGTGTPCNFNYYNDSNLGTSFNGYNLSFNDTSIILTYDGGSALHTATLSSSLNNGVYRKVKVLFDRDTTLVSINGENVFRFKDTLRPRTYDTSTTGYIRWWHNSPVARKIKNLKVSNGEKWAQEYDSGGLSSNISYTHGLVGVGTSVPEYTLDVAGDIRATGNLIVNGSNTLINTTSLAIEDNVIECGKGNSSAAKDLGFLMVRNDGSSTTNSNVAMFWDESTDALTFGFSDSGPTATTLTPNTSKTLKSYFAGSVGIGAVPADASVKLDVSGSGRFTKNGGTLQLVGIDHSYMEYYPDGIGAGRKAYLGYGGATNDNFTIHNDAGSGNIILSGGNVGVGDSPIAALDIIGGAENDTTPALAIRGGLYNTSDLYVLNSYSVSTGVGYGAKVIGVNIKNKVETDNTVQIRNNVGGLTSAGAIYLGSDNTTNQGIFGVLGGEGATGNTLSEYLTVKGNGNIGIGTVDPNAVLDVEGLKTRFKFEYRYQDSWSSNNNQTFTIPVTGQSARGLMLVEAKVIQIAANSSGERVARVKGMISNYHTGNYYMTVLEGENVSAFETYMVGTSGSAAGTFTMKYQPSAGYQQSVGCRLYLKIWIGGHTTSFGALSRTDTGSNTVLTTPAWNGATTSFGGYVGIGTNSPKAKTHIGKLAANSGTHNTIPSSNMGSSADFPDSTHLWLGNHSSALAEDYWGMAMGTLYSGDSYIQNLDKTWAGYYNLLLQPNGGSVGIATATFTDTRNTGGLHLANSKGISFAASTNSNSRHWRIRTDDYSDHGSLQIGVSDNNSTCPDASDEAVMTMNRSRNVGIGTTNPGVKLHVHSTASNTTILAKAPDSYVAVLSAHGTTQGTGRLYVGQSNTYGGGIEYNGDNSPASTGAGADYINLYRVVNGSYFWTAKNSYGDGNWIHAEKLSWSGQTTWDTNITLQAPNATYYQARCYGWNTYSARYLKENIETSLNCLDKVKALRAVNYTWKAGYGDNVAPKEEYEHTHLITGSKTHMGFIADEVAEVMPEVCSFDPDGTASGLDYARITPVLVNAVKELDEKIGKGENSSDDRLKDNETYVRNATASIMKLKPQVYDKRESFSSNIYTREAGLVAQDIWYDAPELRFVVKPGLMSQIPEEAPLRSNDPRVDPDYSKWGPNPASVEYNNLIPYAIKSIQELSTELPRCKTQITGVTPANVDGHRGLIVSAKTGEMHLGAPVLSLSTEAKDKKCFGVISYSNTYSTDNEFLVDATGCGQVWVSNSSPIESGDYLTSSSVTGYAMKQDDDLLHNYTIGKALHDCDFNPTQKPKRRVVQKLSTVTYYIKTTLYPITEERYNELDDPYRFSKEHSFYKKTENIKVPEKNGYDTVEYLRKNNDENIRDNITTTLSSEQWNALDANTQTRYYASYSNVMSIAHVSLDDYAKLDESERTGLTLSSETLFYYKSRKESMNPLPGYEEETRNEYIDVLDEHGQIQWEDDPSGATEPAYEIRYLTADGQITDESNAVHTAALVACTYHCG